MSGTSIGKGTTTLSRGDLSRVIEIKDLKVEESNTIEFKRDKKHNKLSAKIKDESITDSLISKEGISAEKVRIGRKKSVAQDLEDLGKAFDKLSGTLDELNKAIESRGKSLEDLVKSVKESSLTKDGFSTISRIKEKEIDDKISKSIIKQRLASPTNNGLMGTNNIIDIENNKNRVKKLESRFNWLVLFLAISGIVNITTIYFLVKILNFN